MPCTSKVGVQGTVVLPSGDAAIGIQNDDASSANETGNMLDGLLAQKKRKEMGRPTTSREKAPYEGLSKRTRFCTICRQLGHKRTTCPDRGDIPKPVRKLADEQHVEDRRQCPLLNYLFDHLFTVDHRVVSLSVCGENVLDCC